jgi:hypothetical protein
MDENGNRDRRGAEPRDAEYQVRGEDHARHEQQHVVRGHHAGTADTIQQAGREFKACPSPTGC